MPTISLSSTTRTAIINAATAYSSRSNGFVEDDSTGDVDMKIKIMQGSVPSDFTGLTTTSDRSADVLVSGVSAVSNAWNDDNILTTPYTLASASGTATWFWAYVTDTGLSNIQKQFIGNIGLSGSGADLIVGDTTITSGKSYRISGLQISLKEDYTY